MNILVVSQYYYPEPFRINEICEELVKRGHRVTVLTANPNYPDGEIYDGYRNDDSREELNGVKVYRCKCHPRHKGAVNLARNYIDFVSKANKKIMTLDEEFNCIYVYQLSPVTSCLPAIKYKKKHRIPMLLYCLDVWPESLRGTALGNPLGMKVFGTISKHIYKSADKLAVTSPTFKIYLSGLCGIEEKEIAYIPQHAGEVKIFEGESEFKKVPNKINFVFMGNIGEAQNLECLMSALAQIEDRSKIMFHIVGSGSHYENCMKMANELGINDTVKFYGRYPKSEMPRFYAIADICYVSLKDEGIVGNTIPGKVQEYMSVGKPILACINGDTAELIKEANCGVCVPADNADLLAESLQKINKCYNLLEKWGMNARNYYINNFRLKVHVDHLVQMFEEVIK